MINNKSKKNIQIIVIIFMLVFTNAVFAYSSFSKIETPSSTIEIANSTLLISNTYGKEIKLSLPLKRVAVHYPHILELIKALKAQNAVIAVPDNVSNGQWKGLYREFEGMKSIGSGAGPGAYINIETLLPIKPQALLVHPHTSRTLNLVEQLKPYGIPVIELDVTTLDTLDKNVILLGKIFGKEKEANDYLAFINKYLNLVDDRLKEVKSSERPKVYLEFFTDLYTCIKGFSGDPITRRARGINIAYDLKGPQVNSEWVIKQNPDVIIKSQLPTIVTSGLGVGDPSAMEKLRLKIMSRPGWEHIKAVKEGRVYIFNSDLWTSPRIWLGVIYTAKILYPQNFSDIDPGTPHKEYLKKFINIQEDGYWCWPPT